MAIIVKKILAWPILIFALASCAFTPSGLFEAPEITLDNGQSNAEVQQKYEDLLKKEIDLQGVILRKRLPPGIKNEAFTVRVLPGFQHKFLGVFDIRFREIDAAFIKDAKTMAFAAGGDFVFFPPDDDPKSIIMAQAPNVIWQRKRGWIFKLDPQVKKQVLMIKDK